ncbi:putative RNA-directed DNA polymerase [Tanacetum coccineum]
MSSKKSLCGLKQSPRAWFGRFTLAMKNHGFKQSNSDHTLFLKQRGNLITCLIIYVDDMIVTGDDKEEITKLKKYLFTKFEMKDLGRLKYFLGIEIDCKLADTPMIVNQKLYMEEKAELADKGRYQRMVGKLIYLSHTRPDIAYTVGVVSQFMHQPQKNHMKAVLRILRYLKGTTGHGVLFKPNGHLVTQFYIDADWAGDKSNRRSTSGYFTVVGGNLVTRRSNKQKVVSHSSAKAEFRGIARGLTEVLWVRRLLTEIGYPPQDASKIMSDNKAAIQISENPVQHDRTKHVKVNRHFIKEKLEAEIITLPFVRSEDQLANILTKYINERSLYKCLDKLNFGDPAIQLEGEYLGQVQLGDRLDSWSWSLDDDGIFSVHVTRAHLDSCMLPSLTPCTRWWKILPRKVNVFVWRLTLDRLLTRLNLSLRGLEIPSILCPMCYNGVESVDHVFFGCELAFNIWRLIRVWTNINMSSFSSWFDWFQWFDDWRASKGDKDRVRENTLADHGDACDGDLLPRPLLSSDPNRENTFRDLESSHYV